MSVVSDGRGARGQGEAVVTVRGSWQRKIMHNTDTFCLDDSFIESFTRREPDWGPVGCITYTRTYARGFDSVSPRIRSLGEAYGLKDHEEFWLTLVRVVEGVYEIQRQHCLQLNLHWDAAKAQTSAQKMYTLMFAFKFLPPGRGLWMMGTPLVDKLGSAALNNCAFASTKDIRVAFSAPFSFLMDMSMLGVGVGIDTRGAGTVTIQRPTSGALHIVEDSREGWVDLVRRVLDAYVGRDTMPAMIDYTKVRGPGERIKGFGGTASGPAPLAHLINQLVGILDGLVGLPITSTAITDIANCIGVCVVAGNVRRSAEIIYGDADDAEFQRLKDPTAFPTEMLSHRWASNNSIFAKIGMDYTQVAQRTAKAGEPGYAWLDNMRKYGRMNGVVDESDADVAGTNPCGEQVLESFELCTLVETFPSRHATATEYQRTLKYAYLYAKTVTLVPTHDARTNAVMLRNRRLGISMSGVVQAFKRHGRRQFLLDWCDAGYTYLRELDNIYSRWLCVPKSNRLTTVKPSGTTSLLPGVTPGVHDEHAEYYYRVIRFATDSVLLKPLRAAGFRCIELENEPNTTAVYFAVKAKHFDRAKKEVSMWEKLETVAQLQQFWSDNAVSCTVTFKPEEAHDIARALELYESRLETVSFLPLTEHGYAHAPYLTIDRATYEAYATGLRPLRLRGGSVHEVTEKFCDGDKCTI